MNKSSSIPPLLDVEHWDELTLLCARSAEITLAMMVEEFETSVRADVSKIEAQLAAGQLQEAALSAHHAKSSCAALGASALFEALMQLAVDAREGRHTAAAAHFASAASLLEPTLLGMKNARAVSESPAVDGGRG